jgi:hypothetical protein
VPSIYIGLDPQDLVDAPSIYNMGLDPQDLVNAPSIYNMGLDPQDLVDVPSTACDWMVHGARVLTASVKADVTAIHSTNRVFVQSDIDQGSRLESARPASHEGERVAWPVGSPVTIHLRGHASN